MYGYMTLTNDYHPVVLYSLREHEWGPAPPAEFNNDAPQVIPPGRQNNIRTWQSCTFSWLAYLTCS